MAVLLTLESSLNLFREAEEDRQIKVLKVQLAFETPSLTFLSLHSLPLPSPLFPSLTFPSIPFRSLPFLSLHSSTLPSPPPPSRPRPSPPVPSASSLAPPSREAKAEGKLGTACMAKVFEAQLEAAQEIAFDPVLNETCSKDVERLCKDVEPGEGRIQECLVSGRRSGQSTQFLNEWFWAAGVNSMSRAAVEAGFVLSLGYGASRSAS